MPAPLLATKLYLPPLRPRSVPRPRLVERLNEGLAAGNRLTLVRLTSAAYAHGLARVTVRAGDRPMTGRRRSGR